MVFCTIITPDYIHYALAARDSLLKLHTGIQFYIFVSEKDVILRTKVEAQYKETFIIFPEQICGQGVGKEIYDKYYTTFLDGFRWSIKPVFLAWLLTRGIKKVIYIDCDIHFFSDYTFLFAELDNSNAVLTPHWRSSDPLADEFNFSQLYIYGLYNAGFIGVNQNAADALRWWAKANLFICEVNACKGQFVDQTHLNLLPVYFDNIKSLRHRGCNVAGWNLIECKRTKEENGQVLINNEWPVVFIHFSDSTLYYINSGDDFLLTDYLGQYAAGINKYAAIFNTKPFDPLAVFNKNSKPLNKINGKNLLKKIFGKFQPD